MAGLVVNDKRAPNGNFLKFFPIIDRESDDDRNFVKKLSTARRGASASEVLC